MASKQPPEPICPRLRKLGDTYEPPWRSYWQAMDREYRFLHGERYEPDHGPENLDQRLTQIRGREIQEEVASFCAEVTAKPRAATAKPKDSIEDAEFAEAKVALIEGELSDPWKGFNLHDYEAVYDSRVRRHGMVWVDYERDVGDYGGELFFRTLDPETTMWDPAYHPHHPMCGWFRYKLRMPVEWIHENYKGTEAWLKSDRQCYTDSRGGHLTPGLPLRFQLAGVTEAAVDDGKAELEFWWFKNDPTATERATGDEREIPPADRYLSCSQDCGYRSPTQGELLDQGKLENELPEMLEMACPTCGGSLERVDAFGENEPVRAYYRGRRMVVMASCQRDPDGDKPCYDGNWPVKDCRSFPLLILFAELDPRKPTGKSDIYWGWDQQKAADTLRSTMLQRVLEHRTYWMVDSVGVETWDGNRWEARNDAYNMIYLNRAKATYGEPRVQALNAAGLDWQGASLAMNYTLQALTSQRSIVDLGLTEDNSKNIAVGTVEQLTKQGKVRIEEYKRRRGFALSQFYGVMDDLISATYTPQRLQRLNMDGTEVLMKMWGRDMPRFDYSVEESPDFTGLEKERAEAHNALMQVIPQAAALAAQLGLPPLSLVDPLIESFAETVNLPRSVLRKFQRALEGAREQAAAIPPDIDMGDEMGGGVPDEELLNLIGGQDAAGMVPAAEA